MHDRGHIVPPLSNPHLAALRAFLTSIRDGGCPDFYRTKQQQQQQSRAATLEPLDPPNPLWEETEAEQVAKQQQQRQQYIQQQQQGGSSGGRSQQGQYSELINIDVQMGKVPQLASKL
jgi:hypothetical protein